MTTPYELSQSEDVTTERDYVITAKFWLVPGESLGDIVRSLSEQGAAEIEVRPA